MMPAPIMLHLYTNRAFAEPVARLGSINILYHMEPVRVHVVIIAAVQVGMVEAIRGSLDRFKGEVPTTNL